MIPKSFSEIDPQKWIPTPAGHVRFLCDRAGGGALFVRPGSATIQQIEKQPSTAEAVITGLRLAAARGVCE